MKDPASHIAEGLPGEAPDGPCWPLLGPRLSYFSEICTPLSGNFEAQEQGCLNQDPAILQICIEHLRAQLISPHCEWASRVSRPSHSLPRTKVNELLKDCWRNTRRGTSLNTVISILRGVRAIWFWRGLDEGFHQPLDAWKRELDQGETTMHTWNDRGGFQDFSGMLEGKSHGEGWLDTDFLVEGRLTVGRSTRDTLAQVESPGKVSQCLWGR